MLTPIEEPSKVKTELLVDDDLYSFCVDLVSCFDTSGYEFAEINEWPRKYKNDKLSCLRHLHKAIFGAKTYHYIRIRLHKGKLCLVNEGLKRPYKIQRLQKEGEGRWRKKLNCSKCLKELEYL